MGRFQPHHYHQKPAPESQPEATAGTFALGRMVITPPDRYHSLINHLPPHKMSLYECTIEPQCPRPGYDPAMDEPEPPAPRRKPPFKTLSTHHGRIHTLHGETRLYTGYYTACGETYKWAAIGIKYARHEPTVQCDRKSAAKMLRTLRKEGVC